MIHELKTWTEFFDEVLAGRKPFELRKDDRPYAVGDTLRLIDWDRRVGAATGRVLHKRVSYIVRDRPEFGLMPGFCIMGFVR